MDYIIYSLTLEASPNLAVGITVGLCIFFLVVVATFSFAWSRRNGKRFIFWKKKKTKLLHLKSMLFGPKIYYIEAVAFLFVSPITPMLS